MNVGGESVLAPGHLATFFSTDTGGLRLTVPFLTEGLRLGQPCFLVATHSVLKRYLYSLDKQEGVDVGRAMDEGRFTVIHFDGGTAPAAVALWERVFADVLTKRPTLIRIVGEMVSERTMFSSEDEMLRYEEIFEVMSRRYPVVVICQYDVRAFDGVALLRALKSHPDLFRFRIGTFLN